jgi:SAM-dependent methyltransferase
MHGYTTNWFRSFRESARQSASIIVPHLLQLTGARSVVDVGCGVGAWLDQYRRHGVDDLLGVDGDYIDRREFLLDARQFVAHDLQRPLELGRTFDLCQCLEVAEHLPPRCADVLVESLTGSASLVFFSAAVPGQGGTHHVNEQWPKYWVDRFADHGYYLIDAIRHRIWNNSRVDFWYAQNAVLFADEGALELNPLLRAEYHRTRPEHVALVHPHLFERTASALQRTWDYRCRCLLRSAWQRVRTLRDGPNRPSAARK